jgi:F0F1-type ATP synthase membrane subunit b/b'
LQGEKRVQKNLGRFDTANQAALVYADAYKQMHGDAPSLVCKICQKQCKTGAALANHVKAHAKKGLKKKKATWH